LHSDSQLVRVDHQYANQHLNICQHCCDRPYAI